MLDLRRAWSSVKSRWRLVVVVQLLALAAAVFYSVSATPQYRATATLFVTTTGDADSVAGQYTGTLFAQIRVRSYADIISSPLVAEPAAARAGGSVNGSALAAKITAAAPPDKVFINVSVQDANPATAVLLVNAVAQEAAVVIPRLESTTSTSTTPPVKLTLTNPAVGAEQTEPRSTLALLIAALFGLGGGIGLALLRESWDSRIWDVDGMQEVAGVSTLGTIPFDDDSDKDWHTAKRGNPRTEAFRQLRTNLQFVDVDNTPRSVLITSALPGEGKSTTSLNLAAALAEAGQSVILLETDLRRPTLGERTGLVDAIGLSDVLASRVDLESALQSWGTTGRLQVLLAGPTPPNPSELLGSRTMQDLIAHCTSAHFVVLDAPPLLPVADAAILSKLVDGCILVVRAGYSRTDPVQQALTNLRSVDARVFGAVLNMVPTRGARARAYNYEGGYYEAAATN